ncbi:Retrovirus-related Pol poly from transposon [Brachionus plicatilis]|uniref:Retrovirus-related Pol poly from transposon n=1 Tax=Brachionus plicatilis TaxID=10195 RepID=A0A3M7PZQ0_BRAPC|nr:Retrovirus-related Pol poly from transposon [Brachionus plicatilis]
MANLLAPAPFDVEIDGGRSNGTRWSVWIRRFDLFLEASGLADNRLCIATLLHVGGEKIEEIYEAKRNIAVVKKDEKYDDVKTMLSNYFSPQKNVDMATIQFRQTFQRQGEGIDSFSVRLKTLAAACKLGTSADNEIKLQLIQGCLDKRIKLKAEQDNVNLADLLKFSQSLEFSSEAVNTNMYKKDQGSSDVCNAEEQNDDGFSIFTIKGDKQNCPRIQINVLGSSIDVGVDTQASVNANSKKTFDKMGIRPDLDKDDTVVYSFDGYEPLRSIGKFRALVFANKRSVEAEFTVFDGVRDNLLCYKTSLDLELVKIMYALTNESDGFKTKMINKFPELFSGKIGKLKDFELKFHINPRVLIAKSSESVLLNPDEQTLVVAEELPYQQILKKPSTKSKMSKNKLFGYYFPNGCTKKQNHEKN